MNEFLKNIKEGDTVIMTRRFFEKICKVEKITPTGLIKVNGILFNKSGIQRGGDTWSKYYLHEATPERVKKIKDNAIIRKAFDLMNTIKNLTAEQAKQIIVILSQGEKNE